MEAMACGVPVLCSNSSSLPEVAGDAAILVDPRNIEQLSGELTRMLEDAPLRQELSERGRARALTFSWDRTARETLAPGGTLIVNQSMVDRGAQRTDIHVIFVPCNEIAEEIGDKKLLNMVAVGALLTVLPEVTLKDVEKALEGHLPARHKHLLPKNFEALRRGFEAASKVPA